MTRPRVFLAAGDEIGWAIDEDVRLTKMALEDIVDLVDLRDCDVVHCAWWESLMMLDRQDLMGKKIVCQVPGEPLRYFKLPEHRHAIPMVGRWVTRTSQASAQLRGFGLESVRIPYVIDVNTFKPIPEQHGGLRKVHEDLNLPSDTYLIGSFQRDTEGSDLETPKLVKGPDLLMEILVGLRRKGLEFHLILAGPRRHWIRKRLGEEGIPFTYMGQPTEGDDLGANTLPRTTLNLLYNLLDLYLVTSRSEGGPHAILEASASRCKVISTPVGMAPDVLERRSIFHCASDAVEIIQKDMNDDSLAWARDRNYDLVQENHGPESVKPLFAELYETVDSIPEFHCGERTCSQRSTGATSIGNGISPMPESGEAHLIVGLWHSFFEPPYGGGNQFMMALRKGLSQLGVRVRENELEEEINAYVLNSIHFDVDRFLDFSTTHRLNVIHRIDGPIHLIRGFDREKDELCFELNSRFASATVLQSAWTYQRIVEMGYKPVNPVIVHNAVDQDIFHPKGRVPFSRNRKVRLISTSWSNNPRKGGPTYKWIEEHLDWDRFEYTFVGNTSEAFDRIRHIPPVPSEELGEILREHDVYITASQNDPCSNAVVEALACGLPVLYLNDGGHPELVGLGGLPFNGHEEVLRQLDRLVVDYESFQRLIVVPTLREVSSKYLALVRDVIQ